ncbi:hypothetical protein GCM10020254_28260 [Streptomyces goshikiensis]
MDVGVHGAGGGDQPLAGDDRGAGADDDVHPVEGVGVPGPADRVDAALADADGDLADAEDGVDHQHVADHHVAGLADGGGLQVQAVAGGLAEACQEFVPGLLGVVLDPDGQPGVAEADPVPGPRAEDGGVLVRVDVPAARRAVVAVGGLAAHAGFPSGRGRSAPGVSSVAGASGPGGSPVPR